MPVLTPITIVQGVTSALRVDVPLEDPSGWSFRAQIRPQPGISIGDDTALANWPAGAIEVRPLVLLVPLDPEVTSTWTWDRAWFGLEAIAPNGLITRLVQRPVILDKEVVR